MAIFKVWCIDRGQEESDGRLIDAYDAGEAAQEWARIDDMLSNEYLVANGNATYVTVLDKAGVKTNFLVSGETVPRYYVSQAKHVK